MLREGDTITLKLGLEFRGGQTNRTVSLVQEESHQDVISQEGKAESAAGDARKGRRVGAGAGAGAGARAGAEAGAGAAGAGATKPWGLGEREQGGGQGSGRKRRVTGQVVNPFDSSYGGVRSM
eukprot:1322108-Amorphochlora_amoeboformis.AAC.1